MNIQFWGDKKKLHHQKVTLFLNILQSNYSVNGVYKINEIVK